MPLSIKAKEAIKIGLAVTTAYYVALRFSWMSPTWAATSVAFISLPTAGQSLNKGMLRIGGTLLAFAAGLFYLGLFPQDRWLLLLAFTPYLAFITYKVTGKNGQYFWFVAGFVAMMILTAGPTSPAHAFEFAVYRTLETLFGILIWTLISVFIWPRSNLAALMDVSCRLLDTQQQLVEGLRDQMIGSGTDKPVQSVRSEAGQVTVQFGQTIGAAASESYEVREVRHLWHRLYGLNGSMTAVWDRLASGLADLRQIDIGKILVGLEAFFSELDARLVQVRGMLEGKPPQTPSQDIQLSLSDIGLLPLNHFQQAAIEVVRIDLENLDNLTRAMVACVRDLRGYPMEKTASTVEPGAPEATAKRGLSPLDPDRVRAVFMVVAALWSSTLIWIYIDPPGHVSWFQFVPSLALAAVQAPHMRVITMKPFALAYVAGLLVYVFVLPVLSVFWQLGAVLFTFSFATAYFFSGMARVALFLAMFNMFGIQNTQTYNFAAMANTFLFIMLALALVSAVTYITRTPRPEKAFLSLLGRFFHSSAFVVSRLAGPDQPESLLDRMKTAHHRQELQSLPGKLGIWGKQIDHRLFAGSTPDQVAALVTRLHLIADRTGALIEAHHAPQSSLLVRELRDEIVGWQSVVGQGFKNWSEYLAVEPAHDLRKRLLTRLDRLDERIERALNRTDAEIPEEKCRNLYRLMGAYRGLTEAAVGYAEVAGGVDVGEFREEKF